MSGRSTRLALAVTLAGFGTGGAFAQDLSDQTGLILSEATVMLTDSDPAVAMEAAVGACLLNARAAKKNYIEVDRIAALFTDAGWSFEKNVKFSDNVFASSLHDRIYRRHGVTVRADYEDGRFSCRIDHPAVAPAALKAAIGQLTGFFAEPDWGREEKMASCAEWWLDRDDGGLFWIGLSNHPNDEGTCLPGNGSQIEVSYEE